MGDEGEHAVDEMQRRRDIWTGFCEDPENYRRIAAYSRRLAGGPDGGLEIVSEATVKLFELLPDPDRVRDKINYALSVVHNAGMDWLKKRKDKLDTVSLDHPNDHEDRLLEIPAPDPAVQEAEERAIEEKNKRYRLQLVPELRRLDKRERRILLFHLNKYSNQQIADKLNEDVRIIRYDLNRVKSRVRQSLARKRRRPTAE